MVFATGNELLWVYVGEGNFGMQVWNYGNLGKGMMTRNTTPGHTVTRILRRAYSSKKFVVNLIRLNTAETPVAFRQRFEPSS